MAFVIVSAGHLTDSHLRTLRARPLLLVAGLGVLLLMAACVALGYRLAQLATPATAAQPLDLEQQTRVLVDRVGALAGRLVQLESETAALAKRLGVAPVAATLTSDPRSAAAGGPLLPAMVSLRIYNLLGSEVAELVNGYKEAGSYIIEFNTSNEINNIVSGVYFYRLETESFSVTKKMLLLK